MTPMEEAWLVLKYEGGYFTQRPPIEGGEKRFADYERGLDRGAPYSGHVGDDYYNALFQQEEVAALNEAIRQELQQQMNAKGNWTSSSYMPDASPMMQMRDHNFPKVGQQSPPRSREGNFMMRPYRGPDNYKGRLPIQVPVVRSRGFPDYTMNMSNFDPDGGEFIG